MPGAGTENEVKVAEVSEVTAPDSEEEQGDTFDFSREPKERREPKADKEKAKPDKAAAKAEEPAEEEESLPDDEDADDEDSEEEPAEEPEEEAPVEIAPEDEDPEAVVAKLREEYDREVEARKAEEQAKVQQLSGPPDVFKELGYGEPSAEEVNQFNAAFLPKDEYGEENPRFNPAAKILEQRKFILSDAREIARKESAMAAFVNPGALEFIADYIEMRNSDEMRPMRDDINKYLNQHPELQKRHDRVKLAFKILSKGKPGKDGGKVDSKKVTPEESKKAAQIEASRKAKAEEDKAAANFVKRQVAAVETGAKSPKPKRAEISSKDVRLRMELTGMSEKEVREGLAKKRKEFF